MAKRRIPVVSGSSASSELVSEEFCAEDMFSGENVDKIRKLEHRFTKESKEQKEKQAVPVAPTTSGSAQG